MSYEVLAITVPVVAIILMVIFGCAVRHFMIDVPSRSKLTKRDQFRSHSNLASTFPNPSSITT
jgi:hypothetical protein